jgi:protein-disulfide isomerase
MCLATYVAVAGLFLLSGSAGSLPMTKLPRRALGDLRTLATAPVALLLSALFMGTAVAAITMFPRGESRVARAQPAVLAADARTEFLRWYEALPVVALPIAKDGAAVLIVKFNDYQCPPCRASFLEYKRVLDKYRAKPGQIKFVTRDYPLEPECNQYVPREVHPAACEAAVAVRLAAARGGAVKLEEWLFANQQTLTPAVVRQAARDVAGITDFDALYRPTIEQVKADIALGSSLGVRATPTFFINGRKIPDGALPPVYFDTAIAHELQKAGK